MNNNEMLQISRAELENLWQIRRRAEILLAAELKATKMDQMDKPDYNMRQYAKMTLQEVLGEIPMPNGSD